MQNNAVQDSYLLVLAVTCIVVKKFKFIRISEPCRLCRSSLTFGHDWMLTKVKVESKLLGLDLDQD